MTSKPSIYPKLFNFIIATLRVKFLNPTDVIIFSRTYFCQENFKKVFHSWTRFVPKDTFSNFFIIVGQISTCFARSLPFCIKMKQISLFEFFFQKELEKTLRYDKFRHQLHLQLFLFGFIKLNLHMTDNFQSSNLVSFS